MALLVASTGCESGSSPSASSNASTGESCKPVEVRLVPFQIDGGHQLYFRYSDFEFLNNPNLDLRALLLDVTLDGKKNQDDIRGISQLISLDGSSSSPDSLAKFYHLKTSDASATKAMFELHQMKFDGADSWRERLFKKKGEQSIKVSITGKGVKILDAAVTIQGVDLSACGGATPTPVPNSSATPTPVPPAPTTRILSVSPSAALTSSSSIQLEFDSDQNGVNYLCSLDGASAANCSSPLTYSNLSDGRHTFVVRAVNAYGIRDATGAQYSWEVDTVPSIVVIDNAAQLKAMTNSTAIEVQFSSNDAIRFLCSLDSAATQACVSPAHFSQLSEGSHQIAVYGVDAAGNTSSVPASFQWQIDLSAPLTSILQVTPDETLSRATSKSFSFFANESATFECSLDHASYASCASPVAFTNLSDGSHTFEVRGIDQAGNTGISASYSWTIDTQAPQITLYQVTPAAGISGAHQVSADFGANEAVRFDCSFDNASLADCSVPFSAANLSEGVHSLQIQAIDLAGNVSAPTQIQWILDYSAPTLWWGNFLPSAASYLSSISFQAEVLSSERAILSSRLNGTDLGQNASPISLPQLAEGAYQLEVTGQDSVGNVSSPISHSFVIDRTAPQLQLSSEVNGLTSRSDNTLTFSADETAAFECAVDGNAFADCQSPLSVSGLAEGEHEFRLRATDLAGNVSLIGLFGWVIDRTAPETTLTATRLSNTSLSFEFTSDESGSVFECSLDGATYAACTSPTSISGLAVGSHDFRVRAIDPAGNADASAPVYSWVVNPPVTTQLTSVSPSALFTNSTSMTIGFSASVANANFMCSLDGAAASACTSPLTMSGLANGSHTFRVYAIDSFGTQDATGASRSWTVDTIAPTIIAGPTANITSTSIRINWTTSEGATTAMNWGSGTTTTRVIAEDANYVTGHSLQVVGLIPNTVYSFIVSGGDRANNRYQSVRVQFRTNP